jgi:nucleotide-binding universal stress UspA family protein
MTAISRILCPVDFSDCSRHALAHAIALGRECRATVTVLHACAVAPVTDRIVIGAPMVLEPVHGSPEVRESLREDLRRFADTANADGSELQFDVVEDEPIRAIVDASGRLGAELIVLGSHGRIGMDRLLLGSVAESVLRKATCPVLTVPGRADRASPLTSSRILCAIDFSSASLKALQYISDLTPAIGSDICALHVVELMTNDGDGMRDDIVDPAADYRSAFKEAALERLQTVVPASLGDDRDIRQLVTIGRPYREIVRIATRERYDLIVMGVEARSAADLMLFGSTAQHVLRSAPCPVLTVHH